MHVDGVQRDFLRLNFSSAKSVSSKDQSDFNLVKNELLARLFPGSPHATERKEDPKSN